MGGGKSYFLSALAVAALSGGGYYTYHHGRLPDWYWEAKVPKPNPITPTL